MMKAKRKVRERIMKKGRQGEKATIEKERQEKAEEKE